MNYAEPASGLYVLNETVEVGEQELRFPIMAVSQPFVDFAGPSAEHLWAYNEISDEIVEVEIDTRQIILIPICENICSQYGIDRSSRGRLTVASVSKEEVIGRIG